MVGVVFPFPLYLTLPPPHTLFGRLLVTLILILALLTLPPLPWHLPPSHSLIDWVDRLPLPLPPSPTPTFPPSFAPLPAFTFFGLRAFAVFCVLRAAVRFLLRFLRACVLYVITAACCALPAPAGGYVPARSACRATSLRRTLPPRSFVAAFYLTCLVWSLFCYLRSARCHPVLCAPPRHGFAAHCWALRSCAAWRRARTRLRFIATVHIALYVTLDLPLLPV